MALFIQHGAMRNAEDYFCSFKELMLQQNYRNFDDVIIIAPDVRRTGKDKQQTKSTMLPIPFRPRRPLA
jgi:hypothetical protein